jgi:hypothetical protein
MPVPIALPQRVSRHRYLRDILSPDAFDLDQSGGMRLDIG